LALADDMGQYSGSCCKRTEIAIVLFGYGLGNSPSLINMAETLSKSGFHVDFFTYHTYLGDIRFSNPEIQIYNIEKSEVTSSNLLKSFVSTVSKQANILLPLLPKSVQIAREEKKLREAVTSYSASAALIASQKEYSYFIGVEPLGMMAACTLGAMFNTPFIYYNMELHSCSDIIDARDWALKNIEISFHNKALFTITQDEARARIMARENDIASDTFVTIPVCADGEPFREKADYLRKKLGLGADKIIVLYAGFLADWALCEQLAVAAQAWPDKYVLVLHSHGYHDSEYVRKLRQYEGDKVRFSDTPVSYDDLPALLASADIGIALYRDLGSNFTLVGSASGKLAHYLKSGLPVVINAYPNISEIVDKFKCCIGVGGVEAVGDAIESICQNYAEMREGAFRCYEDEFRFSNHFIKVLKRLDGV
jgi:glycosyltransferase involved in cell wall biosynthesis